MRAKDSFFEQDIHEMDLNVDKILEDAYQRFVLSKRSKVNHEWNKMNLFKIEQNDFLFVQKIRQGGPVGFFKY